MNKPLQKTISLMLLIVFVCNSIYSQPKYPLFKKIGLDSMGISCYEILCNKGGSTVFTSSTGLWLFKGHQFDGLSFVTSGQLKDAKTGEKTGYVKNFRSYNSEDSIRAIA